jgi:hypothetical protein
MGRHRFINSAIEDLLVDEVTFWIDFDLINQSARDVRAELDVMPALIDSSKLHFALSHTALTRAWCCTSSRSTTSGSQIRIRADCRRTVAAQSDRADASSISGWASTRRR